MTSNPLESNAAGKETALPRQTLGAGFHEFVPAKVYHADPAPQPSLSSSLAATIVARSPAHAFLQHPRLNPCKLADAATDEMNFGSVVHELILGRGNGFGVWEGATWRGNEASAFWDATVKAGKTPIKRADLDRAEACVAAARAQLKEMGLAYVLEEGSSEVVAIWQEGEQWARAMFDRWIPSRNEVWDIKTTSKSAHPEQIARTVPAMNYDMRSEFYLRGASKLTGIPARAGGLGYQFLFMETEPPHLVTPCFLSEAFRARGRQRAQEAVDTWARCMETGKWPGYVTGDGAIEIQAPAWVEFEIDETEITASGEKIL